MIEDVKKNVREAYGRIAREGSSCCGSSGSCCGPSNPCCAGPTGSVSKLIGYTDAELGSVPQGSDLGLGCGNPVAMASLKPGEIVLDLGSGPGMDSFLAASRVGKAGKVIGVDMTPEMISLARQNAARGNYDNVEFRLGEIENLPVPDNSVDVVISNCVINLCPDKRRVFAETYRTLKPGGRLMVSDIVLEEDLPDNLKDSVEAYASCIAGASLKADYIQAIQTAGFQDVRIEGETISWIQPADFQSSEGCENNCECGCCDAAEDEFPIISLQVSAVKPAA
jgi:arsenite methyltransferase